MTVLVGAGGGRLQGHKCSDIGIVSWHRPRDRNALASKAVADANLANYSGRSSSYRLTIAKGSRLDSR